MTTISLELFFQILNTVLLIFILFLGYKVICYFSDFLFKNNKKNNSKYLLSDDPISLRKKILNWSIIITLLIAYITPGQSSDGFAFNYGYPFKFFTMYNTEINAEKSIFDLTAINIVGFILNILIIYYIVNIANKFVNNILASYKK